MANTSIATLLDEAQSLYQQAQQYREEMNKLPEGNEGRVVYEKAILDLLTRARSISVKVTNTASGST